MEPDSVAAGAASDAGTAGGAPAAEEFVVVARRAEVPPGTMKRVAYGEEAVVLANVDGQLYAVEDECLHSGVPLSGGFIRDNTVICMWHAWRYDLTSGRLVNPPSPRLCLASYPVRVEGDAIAIGPRLPAPTPPPPAGSPSPTPAAPTKSPPPA